MKFVSLNIRGLNNNKKRTAIFRMFNNQNYDVVGLQETYITQNKVTLIEKEWKGTTVCSEGGTHSQGLLILLSQKIKHNYKITTLHKDKRLILISIENNDRKVIIANIYAPCNIADRMIFLETAKTTIQNLAKNEHLILMGDFNTVMDNELDIVSGEKHSETSIDKLRDTVFQLNIHDIWREKNPNTKSFTWCRNNPFVARRLDYIFIQKELLPFLQSSEIKSLSFSDHRAVIGTLTFTKFKRGPNIFKIENTNFIKIVKKTIADTLEENNSLNPHLTWEAIKIEVKETAQQFSRMIQMKKRKNMEVLIQELNDREERLAIEPSNHSLLKDIEQLKKSIEIEAIHKARGAQLRAGIKWIEEGEKSNKFFLALEKSRSTRNTITKVKDQETKTLIVDELEILENIAEYYESLYTEEKNEVTFSRNYNNFITDIDIPEMTQDVFATCEKRINEYEIRSALSKMKNGSSPGSDGIPTEFYKVFWEEIKAPLINCYEYSLQQGYLCFTQKQGIITLLQKDKNGNRDDLSNWRPITLTNADYKILAKTLAMRLSPAIQQLINEDQKGFIKGRNIAELIREIDDLIEHGKSLKDESLVLAIDFRKAFDTISIEFLKETFKAFGFGPYFNKWISIILQDRMACVKNGGYISRDFAMQRGVRQGCPVSPMLFVLAAEILALKIRQDAEIMGLSIDNTKFVVKQYADDTTFFLKNSKELKRVLNKINEFSRFSGLSLNNSKTNLMTLGQNSTMDTKRFGFNYVTEIKILGIFFSKNTCASKNKKNWEGRIEKLKRTLASWGKRDLSIIGKITILKAYGISQFVYVLQSLFLPEDIIKEITRICFNYIWKKKTTNKKAFEKVKRTIMCNDHEEGGLKMIDFYALQKSFVLNWVKKLYESNESRCTIASLSFFKPLKKSEVVNWACQKENMKGLELISNHFWKEALKCWADFNWNINKNENEILTSHTLFNNGNIVYKGKPLFIREFIRRNIINVGDICIREKLMDLLDFKRVYGSYNGVELDFSAVFNALKGKNIIFSVGPYRHDFWKKVERKEIYKKVRNVGQIEYVQKFWERKQFQFNRNNWQIPFDSTKEVRLRLLQWKILHNIYPTRILLHKMKIADSQKCPHCNVVDFSEHFFFYCQKVTKMWMEVEKIIKTEIGFSLSLTEQDVMLGVNQSTKQMNNSIKWVNHVILVGKMVISKIKYGPNSLIVDTLLIELGKRNLI
ncbi:MAG: reverse transcriptase domain-containing protein [Bacteroidota bacterium]